MIEVLIAVLVLSLGLLGYASLLALSLRGNQSANFRTIATNLAYEMFDIMRANRNNAIQYTVDYTDFAGPSTFHGCADNGGTEQIKNDCIYWMGQVQDSLPNGMARVRVTSVAGTQTMATVTISWSDARSNVGNSTDVSKQSSNFTYTSRL